MKNLFFLLILVSCSSNPAIIKQEQVIDDNKFEFDNQLSLRLVREDEEIKIKKDKFVFSNREEEIIDTEILPYRSFDDYCKDPKFSIGIVMDTIYYTKNDKYKVSHWIGQCGEQEIACATLNDVSYDAYTNLSGGYCPKKSK